MYRNIKLVLRIIIIIMTVKTIRMYRNIIPVVMIVILIMIVQMITGSPPRAPQEK